MREMLSYGIEHMLGQVFALAGTKTGELPADTYETDPDPKPSFRHTPVSATMDPDALAVLECVC